MKKLLLALGTVAAVAAPVASVIACGSTDPDATTTFVKPSAAQETALTELGTELESTLAAGGSLSKTEVAGDEVRYTYSPDAADEPEGVQADDANSNTMRATINVSSKELIKYEQATDGTTFQDITVSSNIKAGFDRVKQSLSTAFSAAETVLEAPAVTTPAAKVIEPVVDTTKPGSEGNGDKDTVKAGAITGGAQTSKDGDTDTDKPAVVSKGILQGGMHGPGSIDHTYTSEVGAKNTEEVDGGKAATNVVEDDITSTLTVDALKAVVEGYNNPDTAVEAPSADKLNTELGLGDALKLLPMTYVVSVSLDTSDPTKVVLTLKMAKGLMPLPGQTPKDAPDQTFTLVPTI